MHTWKVFTITDKGPGTHYRYHITGVVLDGAEPAREFSWSVSNLDNPAYDLSEAKAEGIAHPEAKPSTY